MLSVYVSLVSYASALKARMEDDRGATAVEYGLMVALIAAVIITAVALIGTNLETLFNDVAAEITTVTP